MSTSTRDLFIYGAGGMGCEVISMAESGSHAGPDTPQWRTVGFVDDTPSLKGQIIHNTPCLGNFEDVVRERQGTETWCHIAIGDNAARRKVSQRMSIAGWKPATVIHKTARVSQGVEVGKGSFVAIYVTISPRVHIGEYVILNARASVGHDVFIGDFAQISLNASVLGNGRVERGGMIGAHGLVMSNVTIGAWATVAVGTPVLRSVQPGHTVCLPLARTIFKRSPLPDEES